ncbi:MAG: endolytic transglycosylase MltG [Candidatus Margulisbacteria bacterium]|nr:endolytic transglycosylase MltG [Candidatus Margulisiibacteriota bacterium]
MIRLIGIVIIAGILFGASLSQSANQYDHTSYNVVIPKGASVKAIRDILEKKEILKTDSSFAFAARILGLAKHVQAGEYSFSPSEPLASILWKLRRGEVIQTQLKRVRITFPEGTSIYKMGEILRKKQVSDPDKFQLLVKEGITAAIREKHWGIFKYVPTESLEGYLYPDTYWFYIGAKVEDLVEIMLARFEEIVVPFWQQTAKETKYSLHEILTLASIIEKEAKLPEERAVISSVFHNRLKAGMPLAADPTIKYALERPTKRVYQHQLAVDSLYNTYKRRGLPPGPICNPGIEAIKAAVHPATTDYYFFVARKDGSHIFSRNWAEHQLARQKAAR